MERLMPRFRFGHIDPAAVEARRARRGPGYEFYSDRPDQYHVGDYGSGHKGLYPRSVSRPPSPTTGIASRHWRKKKVDVFVLGGTPVSAQLGRARVVRLLKEAEDKPAYAATRRWKRRLRR